MGLRSGSIWWACCGGLCAIALVTSMVWAEEKSSADSKTDFKSLKSPIPNSEESIKRGKVLFARMCTECHGPDGKALMDVIADATDLTAPKMWLSGTTEGEVFRSIRDGAGVSMPPYKTLLRNEQDMWHLVNFVRSLWPAAQRPKLEKPSDKTGSAGNGGKGDE